VDRTAEDSIGRAQVGAQVAHPAKDPTVEQILRFYAPLVATSVLMMVTHSIVSSAVVRTPKPATALAAYSAAYSVGQVFESPCYGMQRMALTFVRDRRSFRTVGIAAVCILGVILLGMSLVAWTPISRIVFLDLLGVSSEVYRYAVPSLRVFMLWPTSSALRSIYQSVIVLQKKTYWMSVNMLMRLVFMLFLASILPGLIPEGPVGASILMAGLCTEAVLAFLVVRKVLHGPQEEMVREVPTEKEQREGEKPSHILRFFLPLALAASLQTLGRPVVTAALSRTMNPEVTLSAYQVALSFSYIFTATTYNIYHAVVIFVKDPHSYNTIKKFCVSIGALASACLFLAATAGGLLFGRIIGTPPDITESATSTLAVLALTPVLSAVAEFYGGILMLRKHTGWVTAAKVTNVGISSLLALAIAGMFPHSGGVAGAAAICAGLTFEIGITRAMVSRFPDCGSLSCASQGLRRHASFR